MIQLTRLNKQPLALNSDLIKFIEYAPDTVITLINGEKIVVLETGEQILDKIVEFRRRSGTLGAIMVQFPLGVAVTAFRSIVTIFFVPKTDTRGIIAEIVTLAHKARKQEIQKALHPEIERNEVSMSMRPEGLVISLKEIGFFDSGTAIIRPDALDAISRLADVLKQRPENLRIEGHTDNVPIHNSRFASNWELSAARATEMIRLLITRDGLDPSRLSAAGYGEFHPIMANTTAAGRAQNRRVDIVVLSAAQPTDTAGQKPGVPPLPKP